MSVIIFAQDCTRYDSVRALPPRGKQRRGQKSNRLVTDTCPCRPKTASLTSSPFQFNSTHMANIAEFKLLDGTSLPWLAFGSGNEHCLDPTFLKQIKVAVRSVLHEQMLFAFVSPVDLMSL